MTASNVSAWTGQVGGFQNRGVCLQAFTSFLPHPLPALLHAPFFARSLILAPRSLLLNRTETLATQARNIPKNPWTWKNKNNFHEKTKINKIIVMKQNKIKAKKKERKKERKRNWTAPTSSACFRLQTWHWHDRSKCFAINLLCKVKQINKQKRTAPLLSIHLWPEHVTNV